LIDLHSHLLPGVDDGAIDNHDAIELLNLAISDGITHIVLTPHVHLSRYSNTLSTLKENFNNLQQLVKQKNLLINLTLGGEVRLDSDILALYNTCELPFIGQLEGKELLLLEFPHNTIPVGSEHLVDWLLTRNILPVIAHPERNKSIMQDPSKIKPFLDRGCLCQLTAMSVVGKFGQQAYFTAKYFLENNWVSVIASDAHNMEHRPPILSEAYFYIRSEYSENLAQKLFIDTPMKLIQTS